jgi:hypothetical protein
MCNANYANQPTGAPPPCFESEIESEMQQLRRYALYLQSIMSAAADGQGGVAESFEAVDDVLGR